MGIIPEVKMVLNDYNTGTTVELNDLIRNGVDIWAFEYPVPAKTVTYNGKTATVPFDKQAFEQKIVDHYRFREIGQETVGRWLHYFRTRIREIMPYYCQLYEFEAKWQNVEDPLESYNLTESFEQEATNAGTSSATSTGNSSETAKEETSGSTGTDKTSRFSDTPQGSVDNLDSYLTTATRDNETGSSSGTTDRTGSGSSESTSTGESSDSGTVSHTLTRRGNIGVQPLGSEVRDIRQAFINIDQMVIEELRDLFLQIY